MRAALIMLAALPLLAAGAGRASFSGSVLDDSAKQLTGAIVTVTTPAGYVASVTTNKSGNFSFASLPAGEYDFRVTARGFAIYERQVTVSNDAGVRELVIRLLVPANKQTVSVTELQRPEITRVVVGASELTHRGY